MRQNYKPPQKFYDLVEEREDDTALMISDLNETMQIILARQELIIEELAKLKIATGVA